MTIMNLVSLAARRARLFHFAILVVALVAGASSLAAQTKPGPAPTPKRPAAAPADPVGQWLSQAWSNPAVSAELQQVLKEIQRDVKMPAPRSQSRLLPLLPANTMFFAASPNYGSAVQQALQIFREHRKNNAALRDWWAQGEKAAGGPKLENTIDRLCRISEFLGDEVVVSGSATKKDADFLMISELRKPGFKEALQAWIKEASPKSAPPLRIVGPEELDAAYTPKKEELQVLVRKDYVVVSSSLEGLKAFNRSIDQKSGDFLSTDFATRLSQSYREGVTLLAGADVHRLIELAGPPHNAQETDVLNRTGFMDSKFLVFENTSAGGKDLTKFELSFTGPRHGIAAWIAPSTTLGSLDFASPNALLLVSLALSDPASIFGDVRQMMTAANPKSFDAFDARQQQLKIDLQKDLLAALGGELTLEVDNILPMPSLKMIFKVKDAEQLNKTLLALLSANGVQPMDFEDGGVHYNVIPIPRPNGPPIQLTYSIVDGYLIFASDQDTAMAAVQMHRSGTSLLKSDRLAAALPPGEPTQMSGLTYMDPTVFARIQAMTTSPQMAQGLNSITDERSATVLYGGTDSLRAVTTSSTAGSAATVMIVAAIAIPNLLRSRIAANEASAVGSMRTINTGQVVYAATYSDRGFAPSLSQLGTDPVDESRISAAHAALLDTTLGCASGDWCQKSGYRFRVTATCAKGNCTEYLTVAEPITQGSTGVRRFCSSSDALIRYTNDPSAPLPTTADECRAWQPLQ